MHYFRLADIMTFGALEPCKECPDNGQLVFRSGVGYQCMGNMSEWTQCQVKTLDPKRKTFKVPHEFKDQYDFLAMYKCKEGKRIVPFNPSTLKSPTTFKAENGSSKNVFPLKNALFVLDDSLDSEKKENLKAKIEALGGKIEKRVSSKVLVVIADRNAMEIKISKMIKSAEDRHIQVVSPNVMDNVKGEGILSNIKQHTISSWGSDVSTF
jgi:NAD-dependent DNA ligase